MSTAASVAETHFATDHLVVMRRSDATPEVLDALAARTDPWPEATPVRTRHAIDRVLADAHRVVETHLGRQVPAER